ncbi:MAG TPA: hypothetical protein VFY59_16450, partial [Rubrobacter sp.]|nr:hypothetical protein [Rubrobacter sp.]
ISEGCTAGLRHRDLTPRPGACQFDGVAWPVVSGMRLLEMVQHMLGAIGRPERETVMIYIPQGAAPTHGHEPRVSLLTEDHLPATRL